MRKRPALPRPLLAVALICVMISQAFFGALLWLSFANHFTAIALEPYEVIVRSLAEDVTNNLNMGKTLTRFQAFPDMAARSLQGIGHVRAVALIKENGVVAQYYTPGSGPRETPPEDAKPPVQLHEGSVTIQDRPGEVHLLVPLASSAVFDQLGLEEAGEDAKGRLDVTVSKKVYDTVLAELFRNFTERLLLILCGVLLAVVILLLFAPLCDRENQFRPRLILFLILTPLLLGQGLFSFIFLREAQTIAAAQMSRVVARHTLMLATKLEHALESGVALDEISDLGAVLQKMTVIAPSLESIAVFDVQGRMLVCGGTDCVNKEYERLRPLSGPDGNALGMIDARAHMNVLRDLLQDNVVDVLTVMLVSLLLMSEMILMGLSFFHGRRADPGKERFSGTALGRAMPGGTGLTGPHPGGPRLGALRGVAFFFFLAVDFSISFIPLRLKELFAWQAGEASLLLLGVPVSMEMAAAGTAILVTGFWAAKIAAPRLLLAGFALAALGNLCSGLAVSPAAYILARSLAGFGYGLGVMSLQNMVIASSTPAMRGADIAVLFAGVYAGSVCGSSLGAMLADRVGFSPVFLLAAGILCLLIGGTALLCGRQDMQEPDQFPADAASPPGPRSLARFIANRETGGLLLLLALPASVISVGMLNFLIPLSLSGAGVKQSDIGRLFMTYSMVFIFLAPPLGRMAARSRSVVAPMILAACLGGMSLFFFALPAVAAPVFWSAFGAVLCSSIALAVSMSSQISFLLGRDAAVRIGNARAMSLYNTTERVGQVGGPMLFGSALTLLGMASFALGAGAFVIACALIFYRLIRGAAHAHSHSQS